MSFCHRLKGTVHPKKSVVVYSHFRKMRNCWIHIKLYSIWSNSETQPNWIKLKLDQSSKYTVIGWLLVFGQQGTQLLRLSTPLSRYSAGTKISNVSFKPGFLFWIDLISSHTSVAGDKDTSPHAPLWTRPVVQRPIKKSPVILQRHSDSSICWV